VAIVPAGGGPHITGENGITRIVFPGAPTYPDSTPRHRHAFGVVYANEIALATMTATPRETFKPGAIIVREKLSQPDSTTPQLLAVMIKREPGFNPAAADWDFLILNGAGTRIRKREKKGACFDCHQSQKDLVYGGYENK
jgi:hypothetical protein